MHAESLARSRGVGRQRRRRSRPSRLEEPLEQLILEDCQGERVLVELVLDFALKDVGRREDESRLLREAPDVRRVAGPLCPAQAVDEPGGVACAEERVETVG